MIADPRAVAARWPDPRRRVLAALATTVTEAPWTLGADDRRAAAVVGLDDDAVLHAVALAAFFGHLNRIADAVAVPLDYAVAQLPPHAEPATPALAAAPHVIDRPAAIDLAQRPATDAALAAWRAELFDRDTARLSRAQRAQIAAQVGGWLGANPPPPDAADDAELTALVRTVTLAPWALGDLAFAALRARAWTDAELFDACAVASSATVFARIDVALRALGR